jgi:thioredoxin-related protein
MKNIIIIFCFTILVHQLNAQTIKLYHPEANASKELAYAVANAKNEGKYVLIQAGGNWCKWCVEFHRFCNTDIQLDSLIKRNFVWYHLNYSKENKNDAVFKQYRFPQRFGFPVFVILNENGEMIHTQNSAYLEDGKSSYDKEKVMSFLSSWSPDVFDQYMRESH